MKQMKLDLKTAQTDRADAKAAVAKATALRQKEAAAFAQESKGVYRQLYSKYIYIYIYI